ncbi:STAS domain-containing protein [Actinomadura kijaniata]|uniref:STAS domain-containing protein n=1 Tax=Actinomadura kijaniata TaxID=46161 RepID=UPI00082E02E3|nr:STAS domain-containing protein [Actinomadura kijaniata]
MTAVFLGRVDTCSGLLGLLLFPAVPVRVGLAGELDHTTTGLLDAELASAVAGVLGASVALELAHLTFASLAGLGLLVIWWRRLTRPGGRLVLLNPTRQVRSALTTTGIDQVIIIHRTPPWATGALN